MIEKKISRKKFIKDSIKTVITSSTAASLLFNIGCKKTEDELKIGYIPITDATPLLIAYINGYFKDEGLNVAKPVLIRSWSAIVEAFIANKINLAHFLIPIPIWMRYNNKIPIKILAWDHTNGSALTINSDSNIKSFTDLGGKQIAVPYWYSMHNVILQLGLRKFNLKPVIKPQSTKLKPDEVNLFILPPPEMPIALSAGKIDGYIVAEPFNALGELKINAKIMRFTGDIWKNHPCCTVVMHDSIVKNNKIYTQKVINAIVRAQHWVINNRTKTAKLLSREGSGLLPVSEKILERVFNGYELNKYGPGNLPQAIKHENWNLKRIGFQPYPYPSATQFIFKELKNTLVEGNKNFLHTLDINHIVNDLVDYSFVKNAINNLGGPGLFPEINYDSPWEREEIIDF